MKSKRSLGLVALLVMGSLGFSNPNTQYNNIPEYTGTQNLVDAVNVLGIDDPLVLKIISYIQNSQNRKTSNNHEEANTWTKDKGTITDIITEENRGPIPDKQGYPFVTKITIETDKKVPIKIKVYSSDQEGVNYTRNSRFPIGRNLEIGVLEEGKDTEGFYKTWTLD